MQRCPCCNARLSEAPHCPRCGADLSRTLRSELLAKEWLSVALRMLCAKKPKIAVLAVNRSLSYKQSQAAHLFRDFLVQHQYRALYDYLARKEWPAARQTLAVLHALHGDNETLQRFQALLEHFVATDFDGQFDKSMTCTTPIIFAE